MRFDSTLRLLQPLPRFPQEVVREEVSQCRVPCAQARAGGPVHRAFIEALPQAWQDDPDVEIFSRLLWVRAGWYPMSLGYHCDWAAPSGAPGDAPRVETLMANFGGCTHTEFIDAPFEVDDLPPGPSRQRAWGEELAARVARGELRTTRLPEGVLAWFDNAAWHRAMPATETGWRLLIRAIRGLEPSRRHDGQSTFTSVRNTFRPTTPEEEARYAPYR